jgi:hypothetical protein
LLDLNERQRQRKVTLEALANDIGNVFRPNYSQQVYFSGVTATLNRSPDDVQKISGKERNEFWKDRSIDEAKKLWEWRMSLWFQRQRGTPTEKFFRRLGFDVSDEKIATQWYEAFFKGKGGSEVEYFVQRIVETFSAKEIEESKRALISLASAYGNNSADDILRLIEQRKK